MLIGDETCTGRDNLLGFWGWVSALFSGGHLDESIAMDAADRSHFRDPWSGNPFPSPPWFPILYTTAIIAAAAIMITALFRPRNSEARSHP